MTTNTNAGTHNWFPTYGHLISHLRGGMTQAQLAQKTGMKQEAVSRLENSPSTPSLATLQKIALATGHDMTLPYFETL